MNLIQARQIVFLCTVYDSGHLNKGLLGEARATISKHGHDYKIIEEVAEENVRALSELRRDGVRPVPVPEVQGDGKPAVKEPPMPQVRGKRAGKRTVRRV